MDDQFAFWRCYWRGRITARGLLAPCREWFTQSEAEARDWVARQGDSGQFEPERCCSRVETPLRPQDIVTGSRYRARKPRRDIWGSYDDRLVIWRGPASVQYDSQSVSIGRHYPTVNLYRFLMWAGSLVTEPCEPAEVPRG